MSNYNRTGTVSWNEGEEWLKKWSPHIEPSTINLMGGEPLMNKDLEKWLFGVREYFPNTRIKLITNGLYFKKKPDLFDWCVMIDNVLIQTSIHHLPATTEFKNNIKWFLSNSLWDVTASPYNPSEKMLQLKNRYNDIAFDINIYGEFRRPFLGEAEDMMPANGDPTKAHSICGAPKSPMLYKGLVYKCGATANLHDSLKLFNIDNRPAWQPYLNSGVDVDGDIGAFVENIGKPHPLLCSACCDDPSEIEFDHYSKGNVITKKEYNAKNINH
jgi:hypothetical protein